MTKSPNQQNFSELKKTLRIRSQHIQQREWIINQKRQSYSTNPISTRSSLMHHQSSRSEFKFGHELKSMRKDIPFANQLEDIPKLVNNLDLEWNSFQTVLDTVRRFRILLSRDTFIDRVIDSGAVQYFVQYLDATHIERYCQVKKTDDEPIDPSKMHVISIHHLHALQFGVGWCITHIVSGTSVHVKYIVETGCVPLLINLMASEDPLVRHQGIWAIGNITNDSDAMRDYVIGLGTMNHLVKLVETDPAIPNRKKGKHDVLWLTNPSGLGVWAISSILKGNEVLEWDLVVSAIPLICQLLLNHELEVDVLIDAW